MLNSLYDNDRIYFLEMSAAMTADETKRLQGERIKRMRQKARVSQATLGEAIGVNRLAVSEYEKGNTSPSLDKLKRIAHILKTNSSFLAGEIDYEKPLTPKQEELLKAVDRNDIQTINKILLERGRKVIEHNGDVTRTNPSSK